MKTKFMAVMGPSGVGKSTIMHELQKLDERFVLIKTHVTRSLRPGETDRVSLSFDELKEMRKKGEALQINHFYGTYYAALPKKPIQEAIAAGMFPMCDYKIPFVQQLKRELSGAVFCVYLLPASFDLIKKRIEKAGRRVESTRLEEDTWEVANLEEKYPGVIDLKITSQEGKIREVAEEIYKAYLRSIES